MSETKKRGPSGRKAVVFGLAVLILAACLILPGDLMKAWDQEWLGAVQEADREYYSREMAAYTGELNRYRKLLLMQGVWKSEKRQIAEVTLEGGVPAEGSEAYLAEESEAYPAEENLAWNESVLNETVIRLQELLNGLGMEFNGADSTVKIDEYTDTELGKYRFSVADLDLAVQIPMALEQLPGTANEAAGLSSGERRGRIRCLTDLENGEILALQFSLETEAEIRGFEWLSFIGYSFYEGDRAAAVPEGEWFPEPMGWGRPDDFRIYSQTYEPAQESTSAELVYSVIQDDSEGLTFFYCLGREETAA